MDSNEQVQETHLEPCLGCRDDIPWHNVWIATRGGWRLCFLPGAAWGPDGDTIYCIKQVDSPKRHFWLCKMNWDGSEKKDLGELWADQDAFVDTQSGALWVEVNAATSNIAFSVEFGNEVSGGLWIIGMDGKNQRRPFPLVWNQQARWAPLHPSWSLDGNKMVYEEDDRSGGSSIKRLVVYDLQKKERQQLTDGPRDQHPVWSPPKGIGLHLRTTSTTRPTKDILTDAFG